MCPINFISLGILDRNHKTIVMKNLLYLSLLIFCFISLINQKPYAQYDIWLAMEPMPNPRTLTAASVYEGKIYLFGGITEQNAVPSSAVDIYDPITNSWDTISAPDLPIPLCGAQAQTIGNKIYVFGGVEFYSRGDASYEIYDEVYVFDPESLEWEVITNLPQNSWYHASTSYDGKLYTFGLTDLFATNETIVFDPLDSTWDTLANVPSARAWAKADVLNDWIYITGGLFLGQPTNDLFRFDPVNNAWETKTSMPDLKWWHSSGVIDETLYVYGGTDVAPTAVNLTLDDASPGLWYYQWGNDSWADTGQDMPELLIGFSSVAAEDENEENCLYSFGGATIHFFNDSGGDKITSSVYKFCPSESTSSLNDKKEKETTFKISPNPAVNSANITLELLNPCYVQISVFDLNGKMIRLIVNESLKSGKYEFEWMVNDINSGIYLLELLTSDRIETAKVIIE
jgi:N-acetylneuraminic acid mutarotase